MLQSILTWVTNTFSGANGIIAQVVAIAGTVNMGLSAVKLVLDKFQNSTIVKIDGFVSKAINVIKWCIDFYTANLAHKDPATTPPAPKA